MSRMSVTEVGYTEGKEMKAEKIRFVCNNCRKIRSMPIKGTFQQGEWSSPDGWIYVIEISKFSSLTTEHVYCSRKCMLKVESVK